MMSANPQIYLLRHGEIFQEHPRFFVGQNEVPLTDQGREQVRQSALFLRGSGIRSLLCSPLSRCVDSAAILGEVLELTPRVVPDLREVSLGVWEGLRVEEVRARFPGEYERRGQDFADFRPLGGETLREAQERIWQVFCALQDLQEGAFPVAVMAHGGVNCMLLCRILGLPIQAFLRLGQDYACINMLQKKEQHWNVTVLNFCPWAWPGLSS